MSETLAIPSRATSLGVCYWFTAKCLLAVHHWVCELSQLRTGLFIQFNQRLDSKRLPCVDHRAVRYLWSCCRSATPYNTASGLGCMLSYLWYVACFGYVTITSRNGCTQAFCGVWLLSEVHRYLIVSWLEKLKGVHLLWSGCLELCRLAIADLYHPNRWWCSLPLKAAQFKIYVIFILN